ncbi:MAG: hypothetical protein VKJ02_00795 [Snowella sp.]|nr:hypothetical protein [Snowella sp.]
MKANFFQSVITLLSFYLGLLIGFPTAAMGQPTSESFSCQSASSDISEPDPLNTQTLISQADLNEASNLPPSLWWAKEQFDFFDGRLVTNWVANPEQKNIDIIVNRQLWSQLNYLERYRFVNKFGTVARENQYNLRVLNQQQKCLVSYFCNFQVIPNQCQMIFETNEVTGFQVPQPQLGEFPFNSQ